MTEPLPRDLGYRMPAEWERHTATWLVWPQNRSDWPGKFSPIAWVYAEIVRRLSASDTVNMVVENDTVEARATRVLRKSGVSLDRIRFHRWPTNRGWTRDSGPIFVRTDAAVAVTDWAFNAWAKYDDWSLDDRLPARVAEHMGVRRWAPTHGDRHIVLEGGAIDGNGSGVLLATEECLLSDIQRRNPGFERRDWERAFCDYLGIDKTIWLGKGIAGDDTHGHVDDIARFIASDTIVTAVEPNPADPNHEPLCENLARLRSATDADGRAFRIIELPMPAPVVFHGRRLPASYANFYIGNGAVLVPTFNDPNDRIALNILAEQFPNRQVVGIYSRDLLWGLGAIHCMTQQQPAT